MKNYLRNKFIAIGVLTVVLLIGLMMIDNLVSERQYLQREVQQEIGRSSTTSQQIVGPIIVAQFKKLVTTTGVNNDGEAITLPAKEIFFSRVLLPDSYHFDSDLSSSFRHRGIYKALLYQSTNEIKGVFKVPQHWWQQADVSITKLSMIIAISDVRGITGALNIKINGESVGLEPGTGLSELGNGVHVPLNKQWLSEQTNVNFHLSLNLQGMESLSIVPVGRKSNISMSADWPHPSFNGNFLPKHSDVQDDGFNASWQTSFFSSNMQELMNQCIESNQCQNANDATVGVDLIDPVDQYLKTDRAIKYAELFILLTLIGFMLFEIFQRLSVHPVQYALVGIALAIFYLLLLSLSEHIAFNTAYVISSVCCTAIIAIYISGFLGKIRHAFIFGGALLLLYLILFGLLQAQDYALLMGSIFIFAVLSAVMILTRHVNWYQLGQSKNKN